MTDASDTAETHRALLIGWLGPRLSPEQRAWLQDRLERIEQAPDGPALATAINLAPRKLGKTDLALDKTEIEAGARVRPGLDPSNWSVEQTARALFMLASFDRDDARFAARLERLMTSCELGEHIALLRGLPLYPAAPLLLARAGEGVRSAIQPIFEAVAHANPYPRERFGEKQWNQMVVKALFIGSRLSPIQGLDERRNPDLAAMLIDYAHERWAAGRSVSAELWRCVGPYAGEAGVADLRKVLHGGNSNEQKAAALALAECALPVANAALVSAPSLAAAIRRGEISWREIA